MKRDKPRLSTVPARRAAPSSVAPIRVRPPAPTVRRDRTPRPDSIPRSTPRHDIARIMDPGERSLLDVVDNLLNSGVMLNADLTLALANVDLVYVRLSALLCAADRILPPKEPPRDGGR